MLVTLTAQSRSGATGNAATKTIAFGSSNPGSAFTTSICPTVVKVSPTFASWMRFIPGLK